MPRIRRLQRLRHGLWLGVILFNGTHLGRAVMKWKEPRDADDGSQDVAPTDPESNASATTETDPFVELETKVIELEDKLLRARADYDNLQKRQVREAELERERAKARIIEPFLQVFEFAQMAATEAEKQPGALAEGVKMLVREFERHLHDLGVRAFGGVGDSFDPSLHEATGEADGDVEPGQVSSVLRPGYRLGERVLRYAKVTTQPDASGSTDAE